MNLPNKLTTIRASLVPFFMAFLFIDTFLMRIFSLVIFVAAALTDAFDGFLARKRDLITDFGKFMDPLADKLLISAAFVSFVQMPELRIPAWMVIIIISREFVITGLRAMAAKNGLIIAADRAGKFKTTSQITTVIVILVILIINSAMKKFWGINAGYLLMRQGSLYYLGFSLKNLPYIMTLIVAIFTVISGLSYFSKHKDLLSEELR